MVSQISVHHIRIPLELRVYLSAYRYNNVYCMSLLSFSYYSLLKLKNLDLIYMCHRILSQKMIGPSYLQQSRAIAGTFHLYHTAADLSRAAFATLPTDFEIS